MSGVSHKYPRKGYTILITYNKLCYTSDFKQKIGVMVVSCDTKN